MNVLHMFDPYVDHDSITPIIPPRPSQGRPGIHPAERYSTRLEHIAGRPSYPHSSRLLHLASSFSPTPTSALWSVSLPLKAMRSSVASSTLLLRVQGSKKGRSSCRDRALKRCIALRWSRASCTHQHRGAYLFFHQDTSPCASTCPRILLCMASGG